MFILFKLTSESRIFSSTLSFLTAFLLMCLVSSTSVTRSIVGIVTVCIGVLLAWSVMMTWSAWEGFPRQLRKVQHIGSTPEDGDHTFMNVLRWTVWPVRFTRWIGEILRVEMGLPR